MDFPKTLRLEQIKLDDAVYPREDINWKIVTEYLEAIQAGDIFPPVELTKMDVDGNLTYTLIDGYHRYHAFKKAGLEEIPVVPFHNGTGYPLLDAAQCNARHGLQLKWAEKRGTARKIAEEIVDLKRRKLQEQLSEQENSKILDQSQIAKALGVLPQRISEWTKDIWDQAEAQENNVIWKLSRLGWSQREIGKLLSVDHTTVGDRWGEFPHTEKTTKSLYSQGNSASEIAEKLYLDEILVWSIILKDRADQQKFKELKLSLEKFNLWKFTSCDPRFGIEYDGRIPGQIMLNLLYYYTKQNDLVVDPMAGGGSTIDACLVFNRRCYAYDIQPSRYEIMPQDITQGLPKINKKCDFVFLDPPYWKQKRGDYSNHSTNLANLPLAEFYEKMEFVFNSAFSALKTGGHIALILGPTQEKGNVYDHAFVLYQKLTEKFKFASRIVVPYTQIQGDKFHVADAERAKYILKQYRDLLVFKK